MRNYIAFVILLILVQLTSLTVAVQGAERYAASSCLAQGQWVKIRVDETGIYQLTYDQLREYGFSDPSRVAALGYGGDILSGEISQAYVYDLAPVPVLPTATHLLSYCHATHTWPSTPSSFTISTRLATSECDHCSAHR